MATGTEYFVHESSYVDAGVVIGDATTIWHFCHILPRVIIGSSCRIGQNVVIGPSVEIGNNVKIQNNVSVYQGVILEDDVFCGPSMVFTNVSTPRSFVPRNQSQDFAVTRVRKGASIGANATVVCGVTIGEYALIGAGAVVTRDVPPFGLVYGNPARQHGWACYCGIPLQQIASGDCGPELSSLDEGSTAAAWRCGECSREYFHDGERLQTADP